MLDVVGAELLLVGAGSGNETGAVCVRSGTILGVVGLHDQ